MDEARAEALRAAAKRRTARKPRKEAFAREKADWDRIANSRDPDDCYEFLKKYPSGKVSELASVTLERIAAAKTNRDRRHRDVRNGCREVGRRRVAV